MIALLNPHHFDQAVAPTLDADGSFAGRGYHDQSAEISGGDRSLLATSRQVVCYKE